MLKMKRFTVALVLTVIFTFYALSKRTQAATTVPPTGDASTTQQNSDQTSSGSTPPVASPQPAPSATTPSGYKNGTFIGQAVDAYYGMVQVRAVISGGKLTDVTWLQYPNDRETSRMISSQAMPLLTEQAIQAQSANVDGVSGATDTSGAFKVSLSDALSQAK